MNQLHDMCVSETGVAEGEYRYITEVVGGNTRPIPHNTNKYDEISLNLNESNVFDLSLLDHRILRLLRM